MSSFDLERTEVELSGVRFPLLGPVQRIPVSPFPAKITIGDYTRDDELVASSWVQTDWSGGFGSEHGRYPQDQDRFWYSTCETRWIRYLSLPPKLTRLSLVQSASVSRGAQVLDQFYFSLGEKLYRIDSNLSPSLLKTYAGTVTDLLYDGEKLWVAGTDFDLETTTDGITFTVFQAGKRAKLLGFLGGWVYLLRPDRVLEAWNGSTSIVVTTVPLPLSWCHQLFAYARPDGEETLYLLAQDGLWVLDRSVNRFFRTQVTWPHGLPVGRACLWRGEVYLPVGSSVFRWNGSVLATVGPDRDQGLPNEFPDQVAAVLPSHGWVLAVLTGRRRSAQAGTAVQPTDALRTGLPEPLETPTFKVTGAGEGQMDQSLRYETVVLASSGGGWSYIAGEGAGVGLPVGAADLGAPMVLYHTGDELVLVPLPPSLHNPIQPKVAETVSSGTLITPWFDAGWAEIDKVGLRLKVRTLRADADRRVRVSYQTEPGGWVDVGEVVSAGETEFDLGARGEHPVFRRIRLKLSLLRLAGSTFEAPVVESVALSFLRRPAQRYAFQFTLDLAREWRGRSSRELRDALLAVLESPRPVSFRFPDSAQEHMVVISRLQWASAGGFTAFQGDAEPAGRASVSVIEV